MKLENAERAANLARRLQHARGMHIHVRQTTRKTGTVSLDKTAIDLDAWIIKNAIVEQMDHLRRELVAMGVEIPLEVNQD